MERSESITNLAKALCNFHLSVEKIKKEATNPFFKSKYATLSNILNVIDKPLSDSGLCITQLPVGEYGLTTLLMHTSGEYISETYIMKSITGKPQDIGSAITYQRRYALGAILSLNIDDDDDGNKANGNDVKQSAPKAPAPTAPKQAVSTAPATAPAAKVAEKRKKLFVRTDEKLVACLVDLVNGTNIMGKNSGLEKWTLAKFETSLIGFEPSDFHWLVQQSGARKVEDAR